MDQFEKEQVKKMNATLREIAKAFTRLGNEIVKLRETIEMTEEKGEDDEPKVKIPEPVSSKSW